MKNILLLLLCTSLSLSLNGQHGVDNIFRKYKNDSGVMSFQFEGDLSSFMDRIDGESIKSTIEVVDVILFNKGKNISEKDQNKLKLRIEGDNYEVLVQARDKDKKIKIMGIENGDSIKKVFAQVSSDDYNLYFFLVGDIHLEDLSKLDIDKMIKGINID